MKHKRDKLLPDLIVDSNIEYIKSLNGIATDADIIKLVTKKVTPKLLQQGMGFEEIKKRT